MLKEDFLQDSLNKPRFPFWIACVMLGLTVFLASVASLTVNRTSLILAAGGTELLFYLLSNALFALVVKNFELYIKRTVLAYLLHLPLTGVIMLLFIGNFSEEARDSLPVFGALVISFFLSIGLVVLIRQVLSILREN